MPASTRNDDKNKKLVKEKQSEQIINSADSTINKVDKLNSKMDSLLIVMQKLSKK